MKKMLCLMAGLGMCLAPLQAEAGSAAASEERTQVAADVQKAVQEAEVRQKAIDVLVEISVGDNPFLRANAIEAMQPLPTRALPMVHRGLTDPSAVVRYASVITAGMLKFKDLAPAIRPLLRDRNSSVRAAALYALYSMGEKVDLTPLAGMLRGQDPQLRGNVALLLGLLGDQSAVELLKSCASVPLSSRVAAEQAAVTRIQIAEAVARLGDDTAYDALRAGAYSQFDEVRVLAVTAMGAVGDRRMELALENLLVQQPVEIRLAAAGSLARLGNDRGLSTAMEGAIHENAVVRSQAAWVLGWFRDPESFQKLQTLLNEVSPQVRVAAAAALVRRTSREIP